MVHYRTQYAPFTDNYRFRVLLSQRRLQRKDSERISRSGYIGPRLCLSWYLLTTEKLLITTGMGFRLKTHSLGGAYSGNTGSELQLYVLYPLNWIKKFTETVIQ